MATLGIHSVNASLKFAKIPFPFLVRGPLVVENASTLNCVPSAGSVEFFSIAWNPRSTVASHRGSGLRILLRPPTLEIMKPNRQPRLRRGPLQRSLSARPLVMAVGALTLMAHTFAQQLVQAGFVGDAGQHFLNWNTEIGTNYQIETTTDLIHWTDVGIVQAGTGGTVTRAFSSTGDSQRFYRVFTRSGAVRPGYDEFILERNDDDSTDRIPIGFSINLFGTTWQECYVNNNGNITFRSSESSYTPLPLRDLAYPIIAPFWADVDTRSNESGVVKFSHGLQSVDGHPAFGVSWINVGHYGAPDPKLNSFQLVLIERSETGVGNFDIEFNYDQIRWETGDASDGVDGYGGFPSRSGLSNGFDQTVEIRNSAQTFVQLDNNPITAAANLQTGLIYRSRKSTTPGRFVFYVRSGKVLGALDVDAGPDQTLGAEVASAVLQGVAVDPSGGAISLDWSILEGPLGVSFSNSSLLNPTVTFPAGSRVVLQLTATSKLDPSITAANTLTINP